MSIGLSSEPLPQIPNLIARRVSLVLTTLEDALAKDPDRKCFRLIGGVLVERTVKDVTPALQTNRDGVSLSFC